MFNLPVGTIMIVPKSFEHTRYMDYKVGKYSTSIYKKLHEVLGVDYLEPIGIQEVPVGSLLYAIDCDNLDYIEWVEGKNIANYPELTKLIEGFLYKLSGENREYWSAVLRSKKLPPVPNFIKSGVSGKLNTASIGQMEFDILPTVENDLGTFSPLGRGLAKPTEVGSPVSGNVVESETLAKSALLVQKLNHFDVGFQPKHLKVKFGNGTFEPANTEMRLFIKARSSSMLPSTHKYVIKHS